jgi:hypothetical protein
MFNCILTDESKISCDIHPFYLRNLHWQYVPNDNMILSTTVTPAFQRAWSEGVSVM